MPERPVAAVAAIAWPKTRGRSLEEIRGVCRALLRWPDDERERLTAAVTAGAEDRPDNVGR